MQQRVAPATRNGDANLASFPNSTSLCFTKGARKPYGKRKSGFILEGVWFGCLLSFKLRVKCLWNARQLCQRQTKVRCLCCINSPSSSSSASSFCYSFSCLLFLFFLPLLLLIHYILYKIYDINTDYIIYNHRWRGKEGCAHPPHMTRD